MTPKNSDPSSPNYSRTDLWIINKGSCNSMLKTFRMMSVLSVVLLTPLAPAAAQTNDEVNAGLQFNFTPPGARSLGMGGAFLAMADDASAAVTNPAGLTNLVKPEFSIEGLYTEFTNVFVDFGRAQPANLFGAASGQAGSNGYPGDTIDRIVFGESEDSTSGVSFASFVYPGDRWAVAAYYHQLANFKAHFQREGPYFTAPSVDRDSPDILEPNSMTAFRILPAIAKLDLEIEDLGIAGAIEITERISLGGGLTYSDFRLDSMTSRYHHRPASNGAGVFEAAVFNDMFVGDGGNLTAASTERGDDTDVTFNVGLLARPSDRWRIGAAFREGAEFDLRGNVITTIQDTDAPDFGQPIQGVQLLGCSEANAEPKPNCGEFKVPDIYGIGVTFLPRSNLSLSLDYLVVKYSQMTEDLGQLARPTGNIKVDDSDQIHFGVEWGFLNMTNPVFLRAGAWHDPDHRFAVDPNDLPAGGNFGAELREASVYQSGEDEMHVSIGVGIIINERVLIDAAYDHSDLVRTATAYLTFRFGS